MMKFKLMFGATSSSGSCSTPINNGRLAMVAITGMVSQNSFFGTTGPETWLPGGAFETELGVQEPVGFLDPLGLSADIDVDTFKRQRSRASGPSPPPAPSVA